MSRATRAFARIVLFAAGGVFLAGKVAQMAGLPGFPAFLAGWVLGLVAACVPWRDTVGLRLQVAALRTFGHGLVYLKADYGKGRTPEAPVECHCPWCQLQDAGAGQHPEKTLAHVPPETTEDLEFRL